MHPECTEGRRVTVDAIDAIDGYRYGSCRTCTTYVVHRASCRGVQRGKVHSGGSSGNRVCQCPTVSGSPISGWAASHAALGLHDVLPRVDSCRIARLAPYSCASRHCIPHHRTLRRICQHHVRQHPHSPASHSSAPHAVATLAAVPHTVSLSIAMSKRATSYLLSTV
jgi:hypothetical protein